MYFSTDEPETYEQEAKDLLSSIFNPKPNQISLIKVLEEEEEELIN